MYDNSKELLSFLWSELVYHSSYLLDNVNIHSGIAALIACYTGVLLGEWHLVVVWFILCCTDLILGIIKAFKRRIFALDVTISWSIKLIVHIFTILLVGSLSFTVSKSIGMDINLIDCYVGFLIFTEAGSIMRNAKAIGLPVPKILNVILETSNSLIIKRLATLLGMREDKLHEHLSSESKVTGSPEECAPTAGEASEASDRGNGSRLHGGGRLKDKRHTGSLSGGRQESHDEKQAPETK